jgi:hypothetical protein
MQRRTHVIIIAFFLCLYLCATTVEAGGLLKQCPCYVFCKRPCKRLGISDCITHCEKECRCRRNGGLDVDFKINLGTKI